MQARFLVVEGLDGSGGTTQVGRLCRWLREDRGQEVLQTCEPTDGPIGRLIRECLQQEGAGGALGETVLPWLFAADRRDHLDRAIGPALAAGRWVVSDRYALSSLAYQSLAVGLDVVSALNATFPAPDLVLVLDLDPEVSLGRVLARGGTRERVEVLERLVEIRAAYQQAIARCRSRGDHIVEIDASGSPDQVEAAVREAVLALG